MKLIVITGTPGTGKSTLAKKLVKKLNFQRVNLHHYYNKISAGYNKSKQSYDIDLKKFTVLIKEKVKKRNLIIDSHISHLLPKSVVSVCIVLICSNLKLLEERLKKRNYSKKKIRENLDAEIFQVCLNEAKEKGHKVIVVDAAKKVKLEEIISKLKKIILPF